MKPQCHRAPVAACQAEGAASWNRLLFFLSIISSSGLADEPMGTLSAEAHGVALKVTPLSPEQKTAFFLARGFSAEAIAPYARACGFSLTFENREQPVVSYQLANWTAEAEGRVRHFTPISTWDQAWEQRGIEPSARIAFRWAQFPAEQEFARGDWIMGMANLMEPPAGSFRLVARFIAGENTLELPIDNVLCAPLE